MKASPHIGAYRFVGWATALLGLALGLLVTLFSAETWRNGDLGDFSRIALGFLIILSAVVASRNSRIAACIDLSLSVLLVAIAISHLDSHFLPTWDWIAPTLILAGALLVFGLCRLLMSLGKWPAPIQSTVFSRRPFLAATLAAIVSFFFVAATMMSHPLLSWAPIGDCTPISLLNEWGHPRGIDFTARILFVGPRTYYGHSLWAIARTERRFSNPSWGPANLIVLRGYFHSDDKYQTYFVEGSLDQGLFSHIFPTIVPFGCGHTARIQEAGVALHILEDGAPTSGGRIIGDIYDDYRATRKPVSGITITATGPTGNAVSVTDAQGIFDFPHLPPGHYVMHRSDIGDSAWGLEADLQNGTVVDFRIP